MRTKKVFLNTIASFSQRYLSSILSFITRTIFIKTLGATYLGVNSLFSDIFMMLSLVELGVGPAMTYFLFKPMAKNDNDEINSLMKIYEKFYRYIGLTVMIIGMLVIPFLPLLVNSEVPVPNLTLIYILLLTNVSMSYFFSYKRSLFVADQKDYVNSINDLIFSVLGSILHIVFLILTKNFIVYLIINILVNLLSNIRISLKANRTYKFLDNKNAKNLSKESKRHLVSRIKAIFSHSVGGVIVFGTDNVLLSIFAGINFVGLYSNYTIITRIIMSPISQSFNAMLASVGNLDATESKNKSYEVFNNVYFMNFWIIGFSTISLFFLFNPFIKLWIGSDFLLSNSFVLVIVINFYISGMRMSAGTFCQAKGLFWNTRFKPIFEAMINLIFSIYLGYLYGAIGIFLGTLISHLATSIWIDPYVLFKNWFDIPVRKYFEKYFIMTSIMLVNGTIINFAIRILMFDTESFILLMIIVGVTSNLFFFIVFYFTNEEKYFRELIVSTIKKVLHF